MGAINQNTSKSVDALEKRLAALEAENAALRRHVETLGASEAYYRDFLEDLPQPAFDMDIEGRFLYANQTGLSLFGYTLAEMQDGLTVFHLLPEDQHTIAREAMDEVAQSGQGKFRVYTMRRKDGSTFPMAVYSTPRYHEGQFIGFRGINMDISILKAQEEEYKQAANAMLQQESQERELAQLALLEHQRLLNSVLETVPVGLAMINEGHVEWANSALAAMTGFSDDELQGRAITFFFKDEQAGEKAIQQLDTDLHQTGFGELEERWQRKDDSTFQGWIRAAAVPPDAHNYVLAVVDIQARQEAENILRLERDVGLALSITTTRDEALMLILDNALQLDGLDFGGIYLLNEATGGLQLAVHKNLSDEFYDAIREIPPDAPQIKQVKKKTALYLSKSDLPPDGPLRKYMPVASLAVVPVLYQGTPIAVMNIASTTLHTLPSYIRKTLEMLASHIGEALGHIRIEEQIRENEERFQLLFNSSNESIVWADALTGELLNFNPAFEAFFNIDQSETLGKHFTTLFHSSTHERLNRIFVHAARRTQFPPFEIEIVLHDGSVHWVKVFCTIIQTQNRRIIHAAFHDITALHTSEAERIRLMTAVEHASEGLMITDTDGHIEYVNPAFEHILGYSREELRHQKPRLLRSGYHEETFYKALWNTIANGEIWQGCFINRKKNGDLAHMETAISPVFNTQGVITHYIALQRDVTDQVNMERQLQHAQRMEALGAMAGGIAHNFKNVLALILGYGEMSQQLLPKEHDAQTCLTHIVKAGKRATGIVNNMMAFSHSQDSKGLTYLDGKQVVKEALDLWEVSMPASAHLEAFFTENLPLVLGEADQLHQVVVNLCNNALHALEGRPGVIQVMLRQVHLKEPQRLLTGKLEGGDYVCLSVRDSGCGIDQNTLTQIFDPFFTTKASDKGTGLGLSTVHGYVTKCGGGIMVDSQKGVGTTFKLYLPCSEEAHVVKQEKIRDGIYGKERIMLVDDDEDMLQLYENSLGGMGYRVEPFNNGADALAFFSQAPEAIDILVSDHFMPAMSGMELIEALKVIRPGLPVILMTAVQAENIPHMEGLVTCYLNKPTLPSVLAHTIRSVLTSDADDADTGYTI